MAEAAKPKHEEGQVQPTPTQEENDLAAVGQSVVEKEHDGSPEPPPPDPPKTDEMPGDAEPKQADIDRAAHGLTEAPKAAAKLKPTLALAPAHPAAPAHPVAPAPAPKP